MGLDGRCGLQKIGAHFGEFLVLGKHAFLTWDFRVKLDLLASFIDYLWDLFSLASKSLHMHLTRLVKLSFSSHVGSRVLVLEMLQRAQSNVPLSKEIHTSIPSLRRTSFQQSAQEQSFQGLHVKAGIRKTVWKKP